MTNEEKIDALRERIAALEADSHSPRPIPNELDIRRIAATYLRQRDAARRDGFYRQVGALVIKLFVPMAAIAGFWIAVVVYFS